MVNGLISISTYVQILHTCLQFSTREFSHDIINKDTMTPSLYLCYVYSLIAKYSSNKYIGMVFVYHCCVTTPCLFPFRCFKPSLYPPSFLRNAFSICFLTAFSHNDDVTVCKQHIVVYFQQRKIQLYSHTVNTLIHREYWSCLV